MELTNTVETEYCYRPTSFETAVYAAARVRSAEEWRDEALAEYEAELAKWNRLQVCSRLHHHRDDFAAWEELVTPNWGVSSSDPYEVASPEDVWKCAECEWDLWDIEHGSVPKRPSDKVEDYSAGSAFGGLMTFGVNIPEGEASPYAQVATENTYGAVRGWEVS